MAQTPGEDGNYLCQQMVNTFAMNLDVREYLRINPISVHELSVSDTDTDCFLLFPTIGSTVGY